VQDFDLLHRHIQFRRHHLGEVPFVARDTPRGGVPLFCQARIAEPQTIQVPPGIARSGLELGDTATMLALGAIGFFVADRVGSNTRSDRSLTMTEAFWIGCAQAAALVPGVSRSGITITVALLLGLRRAEAARFIFLLAIPAILGAAATEAASVLKAGLGQDVATLFVIGIVSSAIVGYVAVKGFVRYLATHSLNPFAGYRLALAGSVVIWSWRS
jgi:undecaprenyl pyrophosphate phosphatase UppP